MRRTAAMLLALLVASLAARAAHGAPPRLRLALEDGLSCDVQAPLADGTRQGGVMPLLFEFRNAGPERNVRATLESNGAATATFSVRGGGLTRRWLYVPLIGESMFAPQVVLRDADTGALLARKAWPGLRHTGAETVAAVVSEVRAPALSTDLSRPFTLTVINLAPDSVPDSWRGLWGVDLLVVTYDAWNSPRLDRGPVLDWVAMGGTCWLLGAPARERDGLCEALQAELPAAERDGHRVDAGMGRLELVEPERLRQPAALGRPFLGLSPYAGRSRRSLQPQLAFGENPPFVPVLLFLVAFSLLVGPVGWWYLVNRRGRVMLYYALAPVLSVCVIGIIVVTDLLKHGVRARAVVVASELVDQRAKKRITLSQFCVYAPFTFGRTLRGGLGQVPHFVSAALEEGGMGLGRFGLCGISVRTGEQAVSYAGALPARRKAWYAFRSVRLERRRLEVWLEGGQVQVENHLGADLGELVVCVDGRYAVLEGLAEGRKASAEPVPADGAHERARQLSWAAGRRAGGTVVAAGRQMENRWLDAFRAGHNAYIARRAGDLAELTWLGSARFNDESVCIIRGLF